ncbi:hypothetical protein [Marinobacterium sedimentorum]|uniref:hypothetical protein n=1 Tax=Marinobacterium sedimentorum TaxID=2927804 RepID=UPI0020C66803|nr:hypothetical protein [Marinobacterium sedimentorum]MCP8687308.1 hypothetical protein [Marinobacterium sedimentorum]
MNKELKNLYLSKWKQLLDEASRLTVKAAYPLLIKVDQAYVEADIKVMIVGQETDGWHGQLNSGELSVEKLMDGYSDYFNQRTKNGKNRGKRAFWNRKNYKYFEEELTNYYPNNSISFIWNNISKIGNDGRGKPKPLIRSLERNSFNIFSSEFKILKPNIVIFTTGSSRDSYIKHHFGNDVKFNPKLSLSDGVLAEETLNLIAEIKLPQLPSVKAVRIEHPNRRTLSNSLTLKVLTGLLESER